VLAVGVKHRTERLKGRALAPRTGRLARRCPEQAPPPRFLLTTPKLWPARRTVIF
jgi:hypothetical protein